VLEASRLKAQGKATTWNANTTSKTVVQVTTSSPLHNKWKQVKSTCPVNSRMHALVGDNIFTFSDPLMDKTDMLKPVGRKRQHRTTADVHAKVSNPLEKQTEQHPRISSRRSWQQTMEVTEFSAPLEKLLNSSKGCFLGDQRGKLWK